MKKMFLLMTMAFAYQLVAQDTKEVQYGAYLMNSKAMWKQSVRLAEVAHGKESFDVAMARYGLLNNTMAEKDEETFDEYIDDTIDLLKTLIGNHPDDGEPKAVLSSIYGLVIAYSPMKGIIYGAKGSSLMDEALEKDPQSALVQKLYASSKLYTPSMWGGNPEKAVTSFELAVSLYEASSIENSWEYLDALMGLALAYKATDRMDLAKSTLEKLIEIEPAHRWAQVVYASSDKE
ncbi:MAG: tetratricopeptide repeat protein [Bacteroidota bacterium]